MKSVITKLEVAERLLGVERYELEIKGAKAHNTIVELHTDINTGDRHVYVQTPVRGGLSPSTADAVARKLIDGARKYSGNHVTAASVVRVGRYAASR
jgi:hypothetical protein